jgi:CRISPR-associated protein Cmr3
MLFLTAPGFFGGPLPPGIFPIAAAVPGYTAVSGWDLAKGGPKPTRFAAPAGSVYFLEKPLDSFPHALGSQEDTALGWGACLTGVWDYE